MFYVTTYSHYDGQAPTDLGQALRALYGFETIPEPIVLPGKYRQTHTKVYDQAMLRGLHTQPWLTRINQVAVWCEAFMQEYPDQEAWYRTFHIPKHSGGFRRIDAPIDALKELQRMVLYTLTTDPAKHNTPFVHSHNAAHAYIEQRSTVTAMQLHQDNHSWWFLKLDLKDFFPSITLDNLVRVLRQIYPLCYIPEPALRTILQLCTWHGVLPQGAVTSPTLSNLFMVPFDKALSDHFHNLDRRLHIYTRYADDLLISCREQFDWQKAQAFVQSVTQTYGLRVNIEKTRYGSRAGRNWNLGLMLNKDNQLTLGYERKQKYRAMIWNFLMDCKNQVDWTLEDVQILQGRINYLRQIEPNYVQTVVERYNRKTGQDFWRLLHDKLGA